MDAQRSVTVRRLSGLVLVVALAVFYVAFGHDWYFNGHMAVCIGEEMIDPSPWCFRAPPPPNPSSAQSQSTQSQLGPPQLDTGNNFTNSLGEINNTYRPVHKYWNDIGNGNGIGNLLNIWGYELLLSMAPYWNAFFRSDPQRIAFGMVTGVFYAALVKKGIDGLVECMHGK